MMNKKIAFDLAGDVLTVTFPESDLTLGEYQEYLAEIKKYIIDRGPIWVILDLAGSGYLKAENRVEQNKWAKKNESVFESKMKGMIFIINNIIVRTMFQTMTALSPKKGNITVVKNLEEAHAKVNSLSGRAD